MWYRSKYPEYEIRDKQKYLNENYPFDDVPELNDKRFCICCDTWIDVADYKVKIVLGEEYILCPNYPKCNGSVIDWCNEDYEGNINMDGVLINVSENGD
ncbi:hypothetical protein ES705_25243 [subsurface metagenome]